MGLCYHGVRGTETAPVREPTAERTRGEIEIDSRSPLEKVPPLYERVYRVLREALLEGELEAGERLTETGVAEWLNVSRTPVREAFRQLQRDLLIEIDDSGRITVPLPAEQDIRDFFECRVSLETTAIRKTAQKMNDELAKRLDHFLTRAEEAIDAGDVSTALENSSRFHQAIVEASGNRRMLELMGYVWDRILMMRALVMREWAYSHDVAEEHRAILTALRAGDAAEAVARLTDHLENDMNRYVRRFRGNTG